MYPQDMNPPRRRRQVRLGLTAAVLTVVGTTVAGVASASVPSPASDHVHGIGVRSGVIGNGDALTGAVFSRPNRDGLGVPTVVSATPDTTLNSRLTAYGNSGDGWTGADSTWSTQLPGGKELFMFSDTFLEPITAPTRPVDAAFVHNSFVQVDSDGHMSTIVGGTAAQPDSLIRPSDPSHWFWLGAGAYLGGTLQVPVTEWRSTGTGAFDLALVGSSLARFSPTNLSAPISITPLPSTAGYEWGQWVLPHGAYTYVYGIEDLGAVKYLHLARVRGTDLRTPFEFFRGGDEADPASWSANEADSVRVMDYVAPELSIHQLKPNLYMLTTLDGTELFSSHLVAYFSTSAAGPWTNKTPLYTTPETGATGSYGNPNVITYNAHVHPELSTDQRLVISYNVNSLDSTIGGDLYRDVSIYRPRFIDVTLSYGTHGH
jgi:hypothetical protein